MYVATTDWAMEEYVQANCLLCVGISLFSHLVAKALFSAPLSLTSVFGMGTGGPSASSTPTFQLWPFGHLLKHTLCGFNQMVTRAGIEPALPAWEAGVLTAWPTSHISDKRLAMSPLSVLVHHQGLEPGTPWLRVRCSTNWANGAFFRTRI